MEERVAGLVIGAGVVSALTCGLIKRFARALKLMDEPNERSSHQSVTPRGGGLSVVFGTLFCLLLGGSEGNMAGTLHALFWSSLLVAGIGLVDDRHQLSPSVRLVVQLVAVVWLLVILNGETPLGDWLHDVVPDWVPTVVLWGILGLSVLWFLNLYNFMDGIDGIAGMEAITVLACAAFYLAFLSGDVAVAPEYLAFLLILVSAITGFLVWNFPRARIFLGDVGSGFLGILIAGLACLSTANGWVSVCFWAILLAVFWVDATYTLLRRLASGQRIFQAHRSHAYQILARRWRSHVKVTSLVACFNLFWLAPLAWSAELGLILPAMALVFAAAPVLFLDVWLKAGEMNE